MLRNRKTMDGSARRRLGRGLESLVSKPVPIDISNDEIPKRESTTIAATAAGSTDPKPAHEPSSTSGTAAPHAEAADHLVIALPVASIVPNRRQPRQSMDESSLEALANSIRQAGLMQPIVVRSDGRSAHTFELVAGERRWRAAQRIGLKTIPAIVRNVDDRAAAELALIENIQREDLNPIDRADAFERLINDFHLTHQELGERVGLDRSTITNFTRLTALDEFTREMVRTSKLTLGHAKVLLAITNDKSRAELATRVVRQGWSVRELERHVQQMRESGDSGGAAPKSASQPPAYLADLQKRLGEHLGTKVRIRQGSKKHTGAVTIEYYSLDQFDGLMERLGFTTADSLGA
jgi:ParB family chromosome partitioning protein